MTELMLLLLLPPAPPSPKLPAPCCTGAEGGREEADEDGEGEAAIVVVVVGVPDRLDARAEAAAGGGAPTLHHDDMDVPADMAPNAVVVGVNDASCARVVLVGGCVVVAARGVAEEVEREEELKA